MARRKSACLRCANVSATEKRPNEVVLLDHKKKRKNQLVQPDPYGLRLLARRSGGAALGPRGSLRQLRLLSVKINPISLGEHSTSRLVP